MNTTERRAAYRLSVPSAPLVPRTWHGVRIGDGAHYGSGRNGFLIDVCEHNQGQLKVWLAGGGPLVCCLPPSVLTGTTTLHGGAHCPGDDCTEGNPISVEVPS